VRAALTAVSGVVGVEVRSEDSAFPLVVLLALEPSTDEAVVALEVQRMLRLRFGPELGHVRLEVDDSSVVDLRKPRHLRDEWPAAGDGRRRTYVLLSGPVEANGSGVGPGAGPDSRPGPATAFAQGPEPSPIVGVVALPVASTESPHVGGEEVPPDAPAMQVSLPGRGSASVTVEAAVTGVTATVVLSRDGVEHVGRSWLPASAGVGGRGAGGRGVGGRAVSGATRRALSAVAAATLRALGDLVGDGIQLRVDSVSLTPVGVARVAIAAVLWVSPCGSERLTGSAEAGDDARVAMVRATVDAVNRRLGAPFLFS